MKDVNKEVLYNQLISTRAAIDAALSLLMAEEDCSHENRKSLTTMGGKEEWICQSCGLHYKESE